MARNEVFTTIRSEGGLLPTDLLARVRESGSGLPGTTPEAYHLAPNERLNEAITRSWNRLVGAWKAFEPEREKAGPNNVATGATRQHWLLPLFQELDFGQLQTTTRVEIGEKEYPISHRWGAVPVHLVGTGVALDRRSAGVRGAAAMSPHGMVQELLNRSDDYLWGIVSNGLVLRLLRDNSSLTRPAYLQFDLEAMFDGEVFADFVVLWLTCHQSRFEADIPEKCLLESWAHEAVERGTRALDQLRVGVEEAIASLGEGFLAHPANTVLRDALEDGVLDKQEYYRELLRLVYRLLFLLVTESRDLLLMPGADETIRARYRDHYGVERLRNTADQVRGGPHGDQWKSLQLVFEALGRVNGEPALGLPGLGGFLWERRAVPHIGECHMANEYLFRALRALSMVQDGKVRRRVDYGDLDSQELGSVYESLLELHPVLDVHVRSFSLSTAGGNERKTTGAYYTPDELVEELLDSALDPVLDDAEATDDPEQALLDVTVLDPACGSGHFLIAAGRRIATRLARVRAEVGEPSPAELTTAMRDVVGRCLHGIDIQEMAVELCKVSLWMAAAEPGKPLSFLEHRIVCGNALLGTTPRLIAGGIPDEAFKPLTGDEKDVVKAWKAINKKERLHPDQLQMSFTSPEADLEKLAQLTARLDSLPDDDLLDLERKQQAWSLLQHGAEKARLKFAADAWCAAFVILKVRNAPVVTSRVVTEALHRSPAELDRTLVEAVGAVATEYQLLHPHIAFPHAFPASSAGRKGAPESGWSGGFDVVLGNPPWDQEIFEERSWFSARSPDIANAAKADIRKRMIDTLADSDPALFSEYRLAVRRKDAINQLIRGSGKFPLAGVGRHLVIAGVFAELMLQMASPEGGIGTVVPTSVVTDDTTKFLFAEMIRSGRTRRIVDFVNSAPIFPAVHRMFRFSLVTLGRRDPEQPTQAVFGCKHLADSRDDLRRVSYLPSDFELLNPNTLSCPTFYWAKDARIVIAIYGLHGVLSADAFANEWGLRTRPGLLNMANDSGLFVDQSEAVHPMRLFEPKYAHQYDHRWATFVDGDVRNATDAERTDPSWRTATRHAVEKTVVAARTAEEVDSRWLFGIRDITNAGNERTSIACMLPIEGVGHHFTLAFFDTQQGRDHVLSLLGTLNSFVFDFVCRQKMSGTHLSVFLLRQLPVPSPSYFDMSPTWLGGSSLAEFLSNRALELTCTAWDLPSHIGSHEAYPFVWDASRRTLLRAEIDAMLFIVYGIERDDVGYIMETFPIVKRKDVAEFGEYRTKLLILEIYDEMAEAERNGTEYETRLDPPPADPSLYHPESTRPEWAKPLES